jgi:hypothetical protein
MPKDPEFLNEFPLTVEKAVELLDLFAEDSHRLLLEMGRRQRIKRVIGAQKDLQRRRRLR